MRKRVDPDFFLTVTCQLLDGKRDRIINVLQHAVAPTEKTYEELMSPETVN